MRCQERYAGKEARVIVKVAGRVQVCCPIDHDLTGLIAEEWIEQKNPALFVGQGPEIAIVERHGFG